MARGEPQQELVGFKVSDELRDRIDTWAARAGLSRYQATRELIRRGLLALHTETR